MEVLRLKLKWKYLGVVFAGIALCGVLWSVHSAKEEQVTQLEKQMGWQYRDANFLFRTTVESLLEWDFSQPLTDADEGYLSKLFNEVFYIRGIILSGNIVHDEWRRRTNDIEDYLNKYVFNRSLSKQEVEDLHQALEATRFIIMDFDDMVENSQDFYDAMHDEQHKMRERIKSRLATQY